MLKSGMLIPEC